MLDGVHMDLTLEPGQEGAGKGEDETAASALRCSFVVERNMLYFVDGWMM
jgi:hypothetical protein